MALARSSESQSVASTAMLLSAFTIIDDYSPQSGGNPGQSSAQDAIDVSRLSESDFVFIEKHPAYSRPLAELQYNPKGAPLGNSSHAVFVSHDREDRTKHFLKFNENEAMLYCESFLNHLYSLSMLQGVGRCYVRYNLDSKPVALSSKEIPQFKTFKEAGSGLTVDKLYDASYRRRFIKILAVMFRMHEDDGHAGNITTELELFDADCAYWDVTYKIKGGRPGVDNVAPGHLIGRDPQSCFKLVETDIANFPVLTHATPWYFPSVNAPASSLFSKNPFSPDETEIVRTLKGREETLAIAFTEFLDWMLDISFRFEGLARLTIPASLTVNNENVIGLYVKKNREINNEYWKTLSEMPEFIRFLREESRSLLLSILIRCEIRNRRLAHDKEKFQGYDDDFNRACLPLQNVIDTMNKLIHQIQSRASITFSCTTSIFIHSQTDVLTEIKENEASELIEKARQTVSELPEHDVFDSMSSWRNGHEAYARLSYRK